MAFDDLKEKITPAVRTSSSKISHTTIPNIPHSNPAAKHLQTAAPQSPKAKQSPNHANRSANGKPSKASTVMPKSN